MIRAARHGLFAIAATRRRFAYGASVADALVAIVLAHLGRPSAWGAA